MYMGQKALRDLYNAIKAAGRMQSKDLTENLGTLSSSAQYIYSMAMVGLGNMPQEPCRSSYLQHAATDF